MEILWISQNEKNRGQILKWILFARYTIQADSHGMTLCDKFRLILAYCQMIYIVDPVVCRLSATSKCSSSFVFSNIFSLSLVEYSLSTH